MKNLDRYCRLGSVAQPCWMWAFELFTLLSSKYDFHLMDQMATVGLISILHPSQWEKRKARGRHIPLLRALSRNIM